MNHFFCVVVDGVGVVEPAVVGVPLLAVHNGVGGVVGLGQLVSVLHFDQGKCAAHFLTFVLHLAGAEGPTFHAIPGENTDVLSRH